MKKLQDSMVIMNGEHIRGDEALRSMMQFYSPDEIHAAIDEIAKEPEIVRNWGKPYQRRFVLPVLRFINPLLFRLRGRLRGRK